MKLNASKTFRPYIINNIKILSVGSYIPDEVVKSHHIFEEFKSEERYDIEENWMLDNMGIVERRVAPPNALPSDMAIPAAQNAIDQLTPKDVDRIDLVIFCGIERDHSEPATAHTVQRAIGVGAKHAFDVSNACFGFIHGIEIATKFISCGTVDLALVVTGEIPSKVLKAAVKKLKTGIPKQEAMDIIGALSVGDAGGAVVLGSSEVGETAGFRLFNTETDSSHIEKCYYKVGHKGEISGQMKMGPIVGASIWMHKKMVRDTLDQLGWDKFDWACMHQTGQRPFEKFTNLSTVRKDRVIKTYDTLGNIASATLPVNFEKLLQNGMVEKGDRVGGFHSGSGLVVGEFGYRL